MKKKSEHADKTIRHRSTFAILFYINRTKMRKDGTCQLLCKVSIDAEWEQIGTKVSVNPDIWNPEKGLANGRSANAVTVNRAIDELTEEITGHYNRIKNSLGFIMEKPLYFDPFGPNNINRLTQELLEIFCVDLRTRVLV